MKPDTWNRKSVLTHVLILGALLTINAAVKVSLWTQPVQTFPDSSGYLAPALRWLDLREYGSQENGFRTPTYPLLIAAVLAASEHADLSECRNAREPACLGGVQDRPGAIANLEAVARAQIVLGMLTLLLVYGFAWRIAQNVWVAALCALTYPVDLSTGYWEISILSDTLTLFLVALTAWLTLVAADAARRRWAWHAVLGLALGALALGHGTFLLYAIVPAAFLWVKRRREWAKAGLVVLIPALFVLAWSARNARMDGYFTPSTLSGYNLTQMVGPFMERAPAPYRDLADLYLKYRSERIAAKGSHSGTIFFAYRDMLDERQTTWSGLSRLLAAMSIQMIAENPAAYVQVAWDSFGRFWKFGLGRQNSDLPASFDWVKWFLDSRVHEALMGLFFLSPLALALVPRSRSADGSRRYWIWFAIATVLYAALFSSALNFGDNERYRAHVARLQYSVIILTAWEWARAVLAARGRRVAAVDAQAT